MLIPPRGGGGIGDYTLRDFAAKWLVQQDDLAEIGRYRQANVDLDAETDDRRRVVLYGDSIIEFWDGAARLSGPNWRAINRGIAGQNTTQMLLRFEDDVIALRPTAVVLLGGTNDLRCYAGPPETIGNSALARISRNVMAMADIASSRGVALLLSTLPPIGSNSDVHRDAGSIRAVNDWLASFAAGRGLALIDYHAALTDDCGDLPSDLSGDGVHPNAHAYDRMMARLAPALSAAGLKLI